MEGRSMESRIDHIALVSLFERARLNTELDGSAQAHLNSCHLCRGRLDWMQVAAGLGVRELSYDPPQPVMEAVLRLGRDSSRLKQLRNAVVALLTFDSFKQPTPAGIRSTEASSRQMKFEIHGVEIGVLMRLSEDRKLSLAGQVLEKLSGPIQDPAARVDLVIEGDRIMTSSLSPWGEFVFPDVPKARYGLQVYFLDRMLQIPSLPSIDEQRSPG